MKLFCDRFDGLAVMDGDDDTDLLIARLRCGMWDCEFCAVKNRAIWRAHIIDSVNRLAGNWLFMTITAHRNAHKAGKTIINLKNAWRRLYDRLRYKFRGQKIEYVWLFEAHNEKTLAGKAKRTFHVHAIVRAETAGVNVWNAKKAYWYLPELHDWLKTNSAQVGAGFMCHCAKINDGNGGLVSAYITKYMTKSAQDLGVFPKHQRRIQTSRGFGSPKARETGLHWEFRAHVLKGDVLRHVRTIDVTTGEVITREHFETNELYPSEKRT